MKKLVYSLLATILAVLTACDYDADKPQHTSMSGIYYGNMYASLYTPDRYIEVDNYLNWDQPDGMLCIDSLWGTMLVEIEDLSQMELRIFSYDTVWWNLPFLGPTHPDGSRPVRECFGSGSFAQFYDDLCVASEQGFLSADSLRQFQDLISIISDTVIFSDVDMTFPTSQYGNALVSYDPELRSNYCKVDVADFMYSRSTSLGRALAYIRPSLQKLHAQGCLSDQQVQMFTTLSADHPNGSVTNAWGYIISEIANYRLSFEVHLRQTEGPLRDIAAALYGCDASGNPLQELWVVTNYSGNYDVNLNHIYQNDKE